MSDVLVITGLTRSFGTVLANDNVDLRVRAGDVVGLLGHNGAGKTTLVSQVVGLLRPDAGAIRVGTVDALAYPAAARQRVALQPQAQAPIDGLTPRAAIEISARLRGRSARDARASALALAEELDIGTWLDRRALPEGGGLSGGVRRLVGCAMALVAPTPLLVFDEPTNDVDASRRRLLWQAIRRRADDGAGVLLVTHNVVEAERIIDELAILDRGRVVAAGTASDLRGADTALRVELQLAPGVDDVDPAGWLPNASAGVRVGRRVLLTVPEHDAAAAVKWASGLRDSARIDSYSLTPATLEDAYLVHTAPPDTDAA